MVHQRDTPLKRLLLRGLRAEILPFDRYVDLMPREAAPKRPATIAGWPPEC